MEMITYQLIDRGKDSLEYYKRASGFCDRVLAVADRRFSKLAADFQQFMGETDREEVRTKEEYQFELLLIGTLWRIYACYLNRSTPAIEAVLTKLAGARYQNLRLKPWIDRVRGILMAIWLGKDRFDAISPGAEPLSLEGFEKLVGWLKATGDFDEEIIRLLSWLNYFKLRPQAGISDAMAAILDFAAWFENESAKGLGRYTAGVEPFLKANMGKYHRREDRVFCRRQSVEYHLNMVGAEIMNRAFRKEFLSKKRKVVFLPVCMRYNLGARCQWHKGELGFVCGQCHTNCQVNQVTRIGKDEGFEVFVIPHESSLTTGALRSPQNKQDIGVVGVACVLNLIDGGWKIKGLGIPAQCVLLDYCGCKAHWHERGMVTAMNISRLREIMNVREVSP